MKEGLMLFNSIQFMFFFPLVTIIYFVLPHPQRWVLLLSASCYFYMVFIPSYILILLITILIDYRAAILIERNPGNKRRYLVLSIISTCLVLFIFKYAGFFNSNLKALAYFLHWNYPVRTLHLILPIGLSFHTFQSLSYVIEVYRGNQKAEHHLGIYALYVMFYPQLVAGPIERPQNLLHQFYEKHDFDASRVSQGLKQMLWGLFKKMVIADRLALYVNAIYGHPWRHEGTTFVLATLFFSIQIYCDFSGYSDIAIGAAKVMGFRLMTNFRRPYFARSISEFWSRWHISLSSWFRDYLYIPLGGNRVPLSRWVLNLFAVFLISGFWHGANWTFLVWGGLHGIYNVCSNLWHKVFPDPGKETHSLFSRIRAALATLWVFMLVSVSWIFFRANSLADAWHIVSGIFKLNVPYIPSWPQMGFCVFGIGCLLFHEVKKEYFSKAFVLFENRIGLIRHFSYASVIILILLLGVFDGGQFIYFQF